LSSLSKSTRLPNMITGMISITYSTHFNKHTIRFQA
jgi:hypothetical protein